LQKLSLGFDERLYAPGKEDHSYGVSIQEVDKSEGEMDSDNDMSFASKENLDKMSTA